MGKLWLRVAKSNIRLSFLALSYDRTNCPKEVPSPIALSFADVHFSAKKSLW